nr:type VI secretion system tube protein Hcp [Alienimonas californiensis]
MFLKIDDVKGEAQDKVHKDEMDVLAWSWGMSQSGTTHVGAGSGAGKASFQDLSITKFVDKASTKLAMACANGKHYKEANLVVRKAGETPLEYIKLKMEDVIVTSISLGGSGGEDRLTENVSLNFGAFSYEYVPQKKEGGGDTPVPFGWDIAANEKK